MSSHDEKEQLALGYAWGREDATGIRTVPPMAYPVRLGTCEFAKAYAQGQDDYDHQYRYSMIPVRDAYEHWQASGGRSIFRQGELTLPENRRAELRALWPVWFGDNVPRDTSAYYEAQARFQGEAWEAAGKPVPLASCGHPADEDGECGCSSWPERASFVQDPETCDN